MKTVFFSACFIHKQVGAQVAQLSGTCDTDASGDDVYKWVMETCRQWYIANGKYCIDNVNIHLVAPNNI